MRIGSRHQMRGWPVRIVALVAAIAMLALAAVTFGGDFVAKAQAQDGAMSAPTLSSDTSGTVVLSWEIPSPEPTDYRIDWAKSGEEYTSWTVDEGHVYPEGTETTVTVTGLEAGVEYKVRMRARYFGDRRWSGPWTADTTIAVAGEVAPSDPPPADGVMSAPTLSSDTSGTVVVSWEIPSPEPTDYRIDWAKPGEEYTSWTVDEGHVYPEGTETTVTVTGLEAGVEYKVRMRARYFGDRRWSGPWTADTTIAVAGEVAPSDPPPADGVMSAPTLSSDTSGTVVVSWEIPNPAPTDYRIDWAKPGEEYKSWTVDEGHVYPEGTETTVTVTGLEAGVEYKVRMRARYFGDRRWSGPWTADTTITVAGEVGTNEPRGADGVMSAPTLSSDTSGTVVVSWEIPNPAPTDYRIDWAKPGEEYKSWTVDEGHVYPEGTETTVTVTGLEAGVEYKVRMQARYFGDRRWSGPWTADTLITVAAEQADPPLPPPAIVEVIEPETAEQSSDTPLISNLGRLTSADRLSIGHLSGLLQPDIIRAVSFTTGPASGGYAVNGVQVEIVNTLGTDANTIVKAAIYDDDGGTPGTPVHSFSGVADPQVGPLTLDPSDPITLDPGTTYWLVLEMDGITDVTATEVVQLAGSSTPNVDSGAEPGWSMGDTYKRDRPTASWVRLINPFKFAIRGQPLTRLVSNLGQATAFTASVGWIDDSNTDQALASPFTTGPNPDGYVIDGVQVSVSLTSFMLSASSDKLKAAIYDDDGGTPGTLAHTVGLLTRPPLGVLTIDAESAITLDPRTTYWLGLELDDAPINSFLKLELTTLTGEDPSADPGWSIGDYVNGRRAYWGRYQIDGGDVIVKFAILGQAICPAREITDTTAAVSIPDPALRRVIEAALGKSSGDTITYAELATVEEIRAAYSGIASMEGLQYATGLKQLRLANNRISSAIQFCGLTKLEYLYLQGNNIDGYVDLSANGRLIALRLGHNRITGLALPHAQNLRTVSAYNNQLASVITSGHLRSLVDFNVSNNNLTSIDLSDIGRNHPEIDKTSTSLYMAHNNLTSLTVPGSRRYELLDAASNELTSVSIPGGNLVYLYLSGNDITSFSIADSGKLKRLDLGYNELSNGGSQSEPAVWMSGQNFPQLEDLWLSGNKLRTLQFNRGQVPKLKSLYLDNNKLHKFATTHALAFLRVDISNAGALTMLDVGGNNAASLNDIVRPSNVCSTRSGLTCKWK